MITLRLRRALLGSFVLSSVTLGLPAVAHAEDEKPDVIEARKQFRAGVSLLDDPDGAKYEEAYHAFKKAYALSHNPKILGNIGFCAMHLERDGEAIDSYTAYLRDVPDVEERERVQIQRDLATLTSTGARVKIRIRHAGTSFQIVDTRLQTRGPAIENTYLIGGNETTLRLRPGRHSFKARADNAESVALEVQIEPGTQTSYELAFPPPPSTTTTTTRMTDESPSVAGPVFLGVTGVLAVGAGVTLGLFARDKQKDIERSCPNDLCPATYDLDRQRDIAKTFGTSADAAFIGGGALLGGALLWYALLPKSRAPSTMASAACTGSGCGLQITRGF